VLRRVLAQGQLEFAIGIAVMVVIAAIGLDQVSGAVHYYFTGDQRFQNAMEVTLTPTPTPTPTTPPGPTNTPTPGPSPTPTVTPTASPTSVSARTPDVSLLCSPTISSPLPGDPERLSIIDSNADVACQARVTDPLGQLSPAGQVTFATSADGGDPVLGIGDFYYNPGGAPAGRQAVPCSLTSAGGGVSVCTLYYRASFSGRPEQTSPYLLRRHTLTATYNPAVGVPLFSNVQSRSFRVRRVAQVVMPLAAAQPGQPGCLGPWPRPLQVNSPIVCQPIVVDRDTAGAVQLTPSGAVQWYVVSGTGSPNLDPAQFTPTATCTLGPDAMCVPGQQVTFTPTNAGSYFIQLLYLPDASDPYHSPFTLAAGPARFDIVP